jgi:hypothetical protein
MFEIREVLRLWRRGDFKKAIARKLGIARNTVREYIKTATKCGLSQKGGEPTDEELTTVLVALKAAPERSHGQSWAQCEEQRAFIEQKPKTGPCLILSGLASSLQSGFNQGV